MKKRRIMTERNQFIASLMFTAATLISAVILVCLLFLDKPITALGEGSAIISYAVFSVKETALCFLSSATVFYALFAAVFSVKTIINNTEKVRLYGIILTAVSLTFAVFGAVVFFINLAALLNFNI